MADHVRQQLREAVATALTGLTTTGGRVYSSRIYPLVDADLPCLMIYTDGDQIEALTIHAPHEQQRSTRVKIEAVAKAVSGFDNTLDTICKEVETAIANASSATVKGMFLQATGIELDQGDQPIAKATLVYSKDLYTLSNAPQTIL